MSNKIIIAVSAGILGIIAVVVIIAISRSGQINIPFSGQDAVSDSGQKTENQAPSDEAAQADETAEDDSLCGDNKCTGSETIETCYSDCVKHDVFSDIQIIYTSDDSVRVEWETSRPMTTVLDLGVSDQYALGTYEKSELTTEHSIELENLETPRAYRFLLRGTDENGQEETFMGPSFEF